MRKRIATQTVWAATVVCTLWCVAPAWSSEPSPRTQRFGNTTGAVRTARGALVTEAVKGKLTPEVIELYYRYAEQCARAAAPADKVTDDFWKWFAAKGAVREGILAGMDCSHAGRIIGCLAELRSEFKGDVDRYWQLAIAFSLVYGRAGDESIRQWDWVAKGRPAPGMIESFRYYMTHKSRMLFPLQTTPWPLLVHVADIDVPIAERKWVLSKYRGRSLKSLDRIHSDPRYIHEGGGGVGKMSEKAAVPFALDKILQDGGVCSQKAYYAASVLKSLGVPAFRLVGEAHAWEGWALPGKRNQYTLVYGPAVGRQRGSMKCPLKRLAVQQHEVEMRAAAMSESYSGYLMARIAAAAYALVPQDRRAQASGLLWSALSRNGHCVEVWRHLAQTCLDGVIPDTQANKVYPLAVRTLADQPQMTYEIFATLISPKLRATKNADKGAISHTIGAIEQEISRYDRLGRNDLGLLLRNLLGSYVATIKGSTVLCEQYSAWLAEPKLASGKKSMELRRYKALVKHLIKLTDRRAARLDQAKFLFKEIARQPARLPASKKAKKKNPNAKGKINKRYVLVAGIYVKTLRKLGKKDQAALLKAKIAQLTAEEKQVRPNVDDSPGM